MRGSLDRRFMESTRGQVLAALRGGAQTVDVLAAALGLTDNAVRAHLATLERDGLVERAGVQRAGASGGKPAFRYVLSADADTRLSRAYVPALGALLDEIADRFPPAVREAIVRGALGRLAAPCAGGTLASRVQSAVAFMESIGGAARLERSGRGAYALRGQGCPLGAVVAGHAEVCGGMRAVLERVTGAPVREVCDRSPGARPSCAFDIGRADGSARRARRGR